MKTVFSLEQLYKKHFIFVKRQKDKQKKNRMALFFIENVKNY